jgi:predicted cupin superfamily sugar epimerase
MAVRRIFAVLLISAAFATDPTLCGGWSNSAADRMACCKRAGSSCASVSADDCCADGEQRQNVESPSALVTATRPIASEVLLVASTLLPSFYFDSFSLTDRHDTYLLDSVFRI